MRVRMAAAFATALTLATGSAASAKDFDVERNTDIVQPATGTGRAIFIPLDKPQILPRLRGVWGESDAHCAATVTGLAKRETGSAGIQIVGENHVLTQAGRWQAVSVLVEGLPLEADVRSGRLSDHKDDGGNVLTFREDGGPERHVYMYLTPRGKLAEEEIGRNRVVLMRCSGKGASADPEGRKSVPYAEGSQAATDGAGERIASH